MPPLLQRAFASVIARVIAGAMLDWFRPFVQAELLTNQAEFATLAQRLNDRAYIDALIERGYAALPAVETFTLFRHTVRLPVKSVFTPSLVALLLVATATQQQAALDDAHRALVAAYTAALRKTA
jgi:hypothetical protein